jgi:hypothetical protein
VAEEMREVAQRFKADELATVRDFMRQAKEVFQRQVHGHLSDSVSETVNAAVNEVHKAVHAAVDEAMHEVHKSVRKTVHGERPEEEGSDHWK